MNPTIIKALIISGGTIGLGAPSIYYGYPYISNLISPVTENSIEEQAKNPSEVSKPATLAPESQDLSGETTVNIKSTEGKRDVSQTSTEDVNNAATNPQDIKPATGDQGDGANTDTQRVDSNGGAGGPGALPTPGTDAQRGSQVNEGSQESHS